MSIKVLIFQTVLFEHDEVTKVLSDFNQDKIYQSLDEIKNNAILSLYLLAISVNECAGTGNSCELSVNNLNGQNVSKYQIGKSYAELYDRDVSAITSYNDRDYDPYVAVILINDVYAGHVYFWSIDERLWNVMGIRSSLQHQYNRQHRLSNTPIAIYLLSAIRQWLVKRRKRAELMRLIAPFPHMAKLAFSFGMVEEANCPNFDEDYYEDGYIGDGPITSEDEACCGRGINPSIGVNTPLIDEDLIDYQLIDLY